MPSSSNPPSSSSPTHTARTWSQPTALDFSASTSCSSARACASTRAADESSDFFFFALPTAVRANRRPFAGTGFPALTVREFCMCWNGSALVSAGISATSPVQPTMVCFQPLPGAARCLSVS